MITTREPLFQHRQPRLPVAGVELQDRHLAPARHKQHAGAEHQEAETDDGGQGPAG